MQMSEQDRQKLQAMMMRMSQEKLSPPVTMESQVASQLQTLDPKNMPNSGMSDPYAAAPSPIGQDFSGAERGIQRQMDYANMLRGKAAPQGRTVGPSNIYVAPNWGESLAYGVDQGIGGYMAGRANKADADLDKKRTALKQAIYDQERGDRAVDRAWAVEDRDKDIAAKTEAANLKLRQDGLIADEKAKGVAQKGENDLRKEFSGLKHIKDFKTQDSAYVRVIDSAQKPSAAGDLALIFNYMKILDPLSVVRESEFRTAEQASSWMQESEEVGQEIPRPVARVIRLLATGERMAPEQRVDFVDRATRLFDGAAQGYQQTADRYRKLSEDYGYNPDNVILARPTEVGAEEKEWLSEYLGKPATDKKKTVVRTGIDEDTNERVIQYSDGTEERSPL